MSNPLYQPPIIRGNAREPRQNNHGTTDGTNHKTVVPAPGEGNHILVTAVTSSNKDNIAHIYILYLNNGIGATYRIDSKAVVNANDSYSSTASFPNGIPLRSGQSLELSLGENKGASDCDWHSSWSDTVVR
jgi:hypothetical protein